MNYQTFIENITYQSTKLSNTQMFDDFELDINKKLSDLEQVEKIYSHMTKEYNDRVEFKQILLNGESFFNEADVYNEKLSKDSKEIDLEIGEEKLEKQNSLLKFDFIVGIIDRDNRIAFERMIFRLTRGNCFMKFQKMEDVENSNCSKEIFIIFYYTHAIKNILHKICEAFDAKISDVYCLYIYYNYLDSLFEQSKTSRNEFKRH